MRPIADQFPDSQQFGSYATAGVVGDLNGNEVQQLVAAYGNYQPFGHAGKDIGCPIGTPIHAMADGVVLYAGWAEDLPGDDSWGPSGYFQRWALYKYFGGIVTVIQHPWGIGVYAHQSNNDAVNVGGHVTEGQVIGLSGNTKTRTTTVAPHVHIEALIDTSYPTGGGLIYGRTDPTPHFGGISAQGTITQEADMPLTDDDLNKIALKVWGFNNPALDPRDMRQIVADIPHDVLTCQVPHKDPVTAKDDGQPTSLATMVGYSDFQHSTTRATVPVSVLNQTFTLPDGTVTNLAGILSAIHAQPSPGVTNITTDPTAVVHALRDQLNK